MTNEKELTHIDLFSGIGGFTLAGEWAGFRTIVFCEKEEFCQKVLQKRFGAIVADPKSAGLIRKEQLENGSPSQQGRGTNDAIKENQRFGAITHTDNRRQPRNLRKEISRREDKAIPNSELGSRNSGRSGIYRPTLIPEIRDFDGTKYRGATLLTGGFPCQPFSVAGQRRGKEDDRYLWPEMLRVIDEARPHWILAENVPGIFRMALDTVLSDLESKGYTVGTFIIPACGLNAPHRRNRVWIIAHSGLFGQEKPEKQTTGVKQSNQITQNARCPHGEGVENKGELGRPLSDKENAPMPERPIENDESGDAQNAIGTRARNQDRKINDQKRRISQDRREGIRQEDGTISSSGTTSANKYAPNSPGNRGKARITNSQAWKKGEPTKFNNNNQIASNPQCLGRQEGTRERIEHEKQVSKGQNIGDSDSKGTIADSQRILSQGLNGGQGQGEPGGSCWEQDWYEVAQRFCMLDARFSNGLAGCLTMPETHSIMGFILLLRRFHYAEKKKDRTRKILSFLQEAFTQKTVQECFGRFDSLYEPKILRCSLHGTSNDERESKNISLTQESKSVQRKIMRKMRLNKKSGGSSFGQESSQQCSCEFDDIVWELSSEMALVEWSSNAEKATQSLFNLWQESRGQGFLHEPLSALYEIWKSLTHKEIGSFKRHFDIRNKNRIQKLKALGNAIVPQIAFEILKNIAWIEKEL